jgi:hypothetical protein
MLNSSGNDLISFNNKESLSRKTYDIIKTSIAHLIKSENTTRELYTFNHRELVNFIKSHMNKLSSIQNRIEVYKDYLNSLVGLSWEAYQQGIEIKKKNDETNTDN